MNKTLLPMLSLALVISCSSGGPPANQQTTQALPPAPATTSESEIGLAPGLASEQPPQAPIAFNQVDPGESELRARPNDDFPPAIPHSIDELETITLSENSCLECHDRSVAEDMEAVAVPVSHQTDLRRTPDAAGDEVVGSRWVCTSCHVAQTDSEALVANSGSG
jgi:cytochrome c-type protein NapB